eukprot:jgi/Chlat1/8131/Chrsp75S07562
MILHGVAVWAVDLLGWGFNAMDATTGVRDWGPVAKHELLCERSTIGKPAVLAGASLGDAAAIEFTVNHPCVLRADRCVAKLAVEALANRLGGCTRICQDGVPTLSSCAAEATGSHALQTMVTHGGLVLLVA